MTIACTERRAFPAGGADAARIEPSIKIGFVNYCRERGDGGQRRPLSGSHTLLNLHFVIPALPFVIVVISGRSASR